jgi:glycyl-tRNA synthetase beta chain
MPEKADFIFELGTEELPPVALKTLISAFEKDVVDQIGLAGLIFSECKSFASPRRLAIRVSGCSLQQPDTTIDKKGPAIQAAFDQEGKPTKAAEGFARSCGVEVSDLGRQKTDKGEWLSYQLTEKGKSAAELLPAIIQTALDNLPIPKRMRWGDSNAMFVRPVHWVLF